MRRKGRAVLIILLTAAAVSAGFSMPYLAADRQERKLLSEVQVRESNVAYFPSSYLVMDCIRLIPGGCEFTRLEGGKAHTEEEIRAEAEHVVRMLEPYGILLSEQGGEMRIQNASAYLAVSDTGTSAGRDDTPVSFVGGVLRSEKDTSAGQDSAPGTSDENGKGSGQGTSASFGGADEDNSRILRDTETEKVYVENDGKSQAGTEPAAENFSAVVWQCVLEDGEGNSLTVWIDDLSGKMVSARYERSRSEGDIDRAQSDSYDFVSTDEFLHSLDQAFEQDFMTFFVEYYGFQVAPGMIDFEPVTVSSGLGVLETCTYGFTDKSGDRAYVSMRFTGDYWEYNWDYSGFSEK